MLPKFEYGEAVRVIRNLRNDGTYPGKPTGRLLIRRGSVGYVRDVGTFLQDQLIYSVDFIDDGIMVGCREQELQLESDPWIPTRFEFRDKVTPKIPLSIQGDVIARSGDEGEIEKVLRDHPGGPAYHARFNGRILLVLEPVLEFLCAVDEEA
ncbi:MAG: nitrogen fixation protein NifZ [Candidatus Thiodiazotropha endolucinida]|nr:nitrogen fixation protein NifZ [Candidatus Thiodiazotropha sp. (ex Lucina pensylvanica)]MCG8025174.1 nitrogen fixation protein NifZ [Candidatus Thiodiazotropha endolucinida]